MTRVTFLGVPIDILDMGETLAIAERAMRERASTRHCAINVAKIVHLQSDPLLASDVGDSDIIGIDGMGIAWALRLFGASDVVRVSGVDLMEALLGRCAAGGWKPYILGARPEVLEQARAVACQRYPGLVFAGSHHGYFTEAEEPGVVEAIRASGADCLFVAMPTPRKERFLARHGHSLDVPFIMGVGGSVDVLAGKVSRAPRWMQACGLEWLHRLIQEPRKLAWRYASTHTLYAIMLASAILRGRNPLQKSMPSPRHAD